MKDFSDVIVYTFDFCRSTSWPVYLFGQAWEFTILDFLLMPFFAFITVKVVKLIFNLVNL